MTPVEVEFPYSLDIPQLCKFSLEVEALPKSDWLRFKSGPPRFFRPTALVMLAKICRRRRRRFSEERITYSDLNRHDYANALGFSSALKLKDDPYPQRAFGGQNYLPMSTLRLQNLEKQARESGTALGDAIQAECETMAPVVAQGTSRLLQETLANSFREMFRNTFEHSGADSASFCAQYWPSRASVEMCIADRGIGVHSSLVENKYLKEISSTDALILSVMPGVSSKAWLNKKKKASQRSEWDNSGYGLFFANRLFGQLGYFFIASGDRALWFRRGLGMRELECDIEGTVISMGLDLSDEQRIKAVLEKVSGEAFHIKQQFGTKSFDVVRVREFLAEQARSTPYA